MITYFLRLLLTASSIAPVCFTVSFIGFINNNYYLLYIPLFIGVFICVLCVVTIGLINKHVQILKKKITSVTPANKEITNYFLAYVFPLLGSESIFQNASMTIFFFVCLIGYTLFSESYNFNPLLSLFGYKFYEAQDSTGVGFVLLSRNTLVSINPKKSINMKQLSDYIYIYYDGDGN
ncbi:hypothetical protein A9G48_00535 [Gilliamella sp. wkB18]|uniref:hypothetical protein n=1 Tax=Gilliamella sp. wkB18 TaxID=3120260 RepID=UPI0004DD2684|nr:hypothetical protein [Gilliamella apicola]KFA58928.1 hypothetical protein GAPWKB11_0817 [Gilliamella apicola]OCG65286.1 hypothetical protein A9G48_00535 [Gilliamella apicola]